MKFLAGGLGDHLDAGLERIGFVEQREVGLTFFAKEFLEHRLEIDAHLGKGFGEEPLRFGVDAFDDFEQFGFR